MPASEWIAECSFYQELAIWFQWAFFFVAVLFLLVISIMSRRSRCKLHVFNARPGPVIPLNLLDGYDNRYPYSVAFVITARYIINGLLASEEKVDKYAALYVQILSVVIFVTSAYPFFVCIGMRNRFIGSTSGLLFTATWLSIKGYYFIGVILNCNLQKGAVATAIIYQIPEFMALILLGFFFLRKLFTYRRDGLKFLFEDENLPKDDHMLSYVANLLKTNNKERAVTKSMAKRYVQMVKNKLYKPMPEFKLPTRIVCTITVCFVTLYMLTVSFIANGNAIFTYLELIISPSKHNRIYNIFKSCWYIAAVSSLLRSCLLLMNILQCHRKNLMLLRVGNRSWLPKSMKRYESSPTSLTLASMKYAGYQIGYVIIGYIIQFFFLLILPATIISALTLKYTWKKLLEYLPIFVTIMVIYVSQRLLAKFAFVQKKDGTVIINNRKAFNIVSFYMIFYNALLGTFSAVYRIATGLVIGVLYFERVQKSVLPRSFESFDTGYYSYIGYLQIEHTFSNPVLRAFLYLLKCEAYHKSRTPNESFFDADVGSKYHRWSDTSNYDNQNPRQRNKWLVAYTLLKNPSLIQMRKRYLVFEEKVIPKHAFDKN